MALTQFFIKKGLAWTWGKIQRLHIVIKAYASVDGSEFSESNSTRLGIIPVTCDIEVRIILSYSSASSQNTLQAVRMTRVLLFSLFEILVSRRKLDRRPIKPLLMISLVSSTRFFMIFINSSKAKVVPPTFSSFLMSKFCMQYFERKSMPPFLSRNYFKAVSLSPIYNWIIDHLHSVIIISKASLTISTLEFGWLIMLSSYFRQWL